MCPKAYRRHWQPHACIEQQFVDRSALGLFAQLSGYVDRKVSSTIDRPEPVKHLLLQDRACDYYPL